MNQRFTRPPLPPPLRPSSPARTPRIWISQDARTLIALEWVTSVTTATETGGQLTVRLGGDTVVLDAANGRDFTAAYLRFHMHGFPAPQPNHSKKQS